MIEISCSKTTTPPSNIAVHGATWLLLIIISVTRPVMQIQFLHSGFGKGDK